MLTVRRSRRRRGDVRRMKVRNDARWSTVFPPR